MRPLDETLGRPGNMGVHGFPNALNSPLFSQDTGGKLELLTIPGFFVSAERTDGIGFAPFIILCHVVRLRGHGFS